MNKLPVCLLGPSASGKTRLALSVATALDAEIVSVDSVLVYRLLDIGSAKPTITERNAVMHHLIDIRDLEQPYNVACFVHDAHRAIKAIQARGKRPLLVGGSMMYFNALLKGLSSMPIQPQQQQLSQQDMHQALATLDPAAHQRIHANDTIRTARSYYLASKGTTQQQYWSSTLLYEPLEALVCCLAPPKRQLLKDNIKQRVIRMLQAGLIAETVDIVNAKPDFLITPPKPLQTIGYAQVLRYIQQGQSASVILLREQIARATNLLVKRQTTWLKKLPIDVILNCLAPTTRLTSDMLSAVQRAENAKMRKTYSKIEQSAHTFQLPT